MDGHKDDLYQDSNLEKPPTVAKPDGVVGKLAATAEKTGHVVGEQKPTNANAKKADKDNLKQTAADQAECFTSASNGWCKVRRMLSKSWESDLVPYIQQNNDIVAEYNRKLALENAHDILEYSVDDIDTPYVLISVIGDSKDFQPKNWSKLSFQKAILKLVKRAEECLVMYNKPGPKSTIGTLVEDAFKNHSIKEGRLLRYRYVKFEDDEEQDSRDTGICLYSHRLMSVCNLRKKDNKQRNHDDHLTTMYKLEDYIHEVGKIRIDFINGVKKTPVVLILAEGDRQSIRHVADAVTMGTIVYVIKGSGKAADLIAEYLEKEESNNNFFERKVAEKFGLAFLDNDEDTKNKQDTKIDKRRPGLKELKQYLETINKNSCRITVFDIDQENPTALADKISESVSSSWTIDNSDFKDDYCWIPNIYIPLAYRYIQQHNKYDSFKASSLLQRAFDVSPDVVKLLLDKGASLRKIYDHEKDSYEYKVPQEPSVRKPVIDILQGAFESRPWYEVSYYRERSWYEVSYYRERLRFLRIQCQELVGYKKEKTMKEMSEEQLSELFMFEFVLQNKPEMADIFWQRCPNQMVTALVMSAFLEKKSEIEMELRKRSYATGLMKMSSTLEQRATFILDKMRIIDEVDETQLEAETYEEFAMEDTANGDNYDEEFRILEEPVSVMGLDVTPIVFAFNNERLDFLSHSACKQYLHTLWTDDYKKAKSTVRKVKKFVTSPRMNFWISYFFYLVAMICISIFILTDVKKLTRFYNVSYYQMAFTVWIVGDCLEEFLPSPEERWKGHWNNPKVHDLSLLKRIGNWFFDFWNMLDAACYISYALGVASHILSTDPSMNITRRLYSLTTVFMYARFMRVLLMWKEIGTKVIVIGYMMVDLLRFLSILGIVLFGVGVAYHAHIYPNFTPLFDSDWGGRWTDARIFNIIGMPYWQIYGDPQLGTLKSESIAYCQAQNITSDCGMDFSVPLISFIYMLFGHALLLNLVIAMFSNRYESMERNSEKVYNYRFRYLVFEYKTRLPSPINLLVRSFQILPMLIRNVVCCIRNVVCCRPRKIGVFEKTEIFSVEKPFVAEKPFPAKKLMTRREVNYRNVTPDGVDETTTSFQFEVKSGEDVFVGLFAYPPDKQEGEMTEVMINGSDKENSIITNRQKDVLIIKDTIDILHKSEYRKFQIEWRKDQNGKVTYIYARRYNGNYNLEMEAKVPSNMDINHIAIYTSSQSEGSWKFASTSKDKDNTTDKMTKRKDGYRFAEDIDIKEVSNSVIKEGSTSVFFEFEVRAKCDAHLVLFAKPEGTATNLHELARTQKKFEMIKVILGGARNTKSWITYTNCAQIQNLDKVETLDKVNTILSKYPKENHYWISWGEMRNEKKIIKVGTGTDVDMKRFMKGSLDPFPVYFIGVSTSDQTYRSYRFNPEKTIFTPKEFNYQLLTPIPMMSVHKAVTFAVKAKSDAHVALCNKIPGRCDGDMYEVVIGGEGNSISFIRNIHVSHKYLHSHPGGIRYPDNYNKFWISWANGRIMVGEGDYCTNMENHSFLDYRYKDYAVRYLAVSTGPNSKGYWKFHADNSYPDEAKKEKTQLKWKRSQDLLASVCIHGNDKTLEI